MHSVVAAVSIWNQLLAKREPRTHPDFCPVSASATEFIQRCEGSRARETEMLDLSDKSRQWLGVAEQMLEQRVRGWH